MIAYEEKATLPGRQYGINQKQNYITRLAAGGQRLSDTGIVELSPDVSGTVAMAQLGGTALALQHTPDVESDLLCPLVLVSSNLSCYPNIGCQSLPDSLAFLRSSAFSLRPQASNTHAEKLALEFSALSLSTLASISSMSSWGNRMCFLADLLLVLPVAICAILKFGVSTPYTKKMAIKTIDMGAHQNVWWVHTLFCLRCQNSEAQQCANTNWASYHKPLSEVTTMAESQHTQTRPEFTWRFLSTSERYPTAKPLVIYVNASSEQEARDTMPGVNLVFAARLPYHMFQVLEVRHA